MLEEMGKSGTALLLVSGTDVVPDIDGHRRGDVVWTGDDAQPVVQRVFDDRVAETGERARSHAPHHSTSPEPSFPLGLGVGVEDLDDPNGTALRTTSKERNTKAQRDAVRQCEQPVGGNHNAQDSEHYESDAGNPGLAGYHGGGCGRGPRRLPTHS